MKVIVITGASDGIGAELARQWAQTERDKVALVLAARNTENLQTVAAQCQQYGAPTRVVPTDVADQAQCIALITETIAAFGRLDILVNNAGKSAHALLEDVTDLSWYRQLMDINHWGSVWCTHAALPHLKRSQGRLVAVSSLAGLVGVPGRTAYCATKWAMNGFFNALRVELAPAGVSVTLVYPGVVSTQIRHHGFNAQGQAAGVSSLDEQGAMSVSTCARLIRRGVDKRQREVVMTAKGKIARLMGLLAPSLVDRLATAALHKNASQPHRKA